MEHIVRVMRKWAKDNRVPVWIKSLKIFELNVFTSFQVLLYFCFTVFTLKLPWSTDFDLRAPFRASIAVFIFSVKRKSERSQYLWSVSRFLVMGGNKKRLGSQYQMTIFSLHDHQQILNQYYFGNSEIFIPWEQTWERDIFSQETLSLGFVGCLRFPSKLPTNRTSETNFTLLPLITILQSWSAGKGWEYWFNRK